MVLQCDLGQGGDLQKKKQSSRAISCLCKAAATAKEVERKPAIAGHCSAHALLEATGKKKDKKVVT